MAAGCGEALGGKVQVTKQRFKDILRDVGDHMHETMKKNEDKYRQVEDPEKTADILGISS